MEKELGQAGSGWVRSIESSLSCDMSLLKYLLQGGGHYSTSGQFSENYLFFIQINVKGFEF